MAKNTGEDFRRGAVRSRSQVENEEGHWTKRDAATGEFMDQKSDEKPFKGVRREHAEKSRDEAPHAR